MLRTLMILQRVIVMTDVVKSWKRNMVPSDLPLPEPHRSGNYIYFSNSPTRLVNFARIRCNRLIQRETRFVLIYWVN